jgi:hypothetical protein
MTYDWFQSRFTASDLNGKSVAFRVPLEQGGILEGEGRFNANQDARGWIRVAIDYIKMTQQGAFGARVFVPTEAAESIVRNPPGSKCEFSCIVA